VIGKIGFATATALLVLTASPVFAQGPPPAPKWELEAHFGETVVWNPLDGIPQSPPAAPFFSTGPGRVSRPVSSWYWGDGAVLITEGAGLLRVPNSQQIVPLDNFMGMPSLELKSGPSFAPASATRNRCTSVRSVGDGRTGNIEALDGIADAVERTRASFMRSGRRSWRPRRIFRSLDGDVGLDLRSRHGWTARGDRIDRHAALPDKDIIPYISVGGGMLATTRATCRRSPSTGRYTTQLDGAASFDESDTVVARYDLDKHLVVTMVGVGWKHMLSDRWGVRADLREHLSGNRVRQVLEAAPSVVVAAPAVPALRSIGTFETIQLSNQNTATVPTTLSVRTSRNFTMFKREPGWKAGSRRASGFSSGLSVR
jgi:hypothetical protein